MAPFNISQIKQLCRLDLSSEEEEAIKKSFSKILDYMHQLDEIDTEGVAPCRFVSKEILKNQMREDILGETLTREQFLSNAPDQIGGMIRIPPVLKP